MPESGRKAIPLACPGISLFEIRNPGAIGSSGRRAAPVVLVIEGLTR